MHLHNGQHQEQTFYNTGNVGIGTNNPSNILQVGDGGRLKISIGIADFTLIGTKDNIELVDKLFKWLNIVVVVAFKLLIDDIVFGPMTDPPTFNDDYIVAWFDVKLYEVISYIPELFIILFIIY